MSLLMRMLLFGSLIPNACDYMSLIPSLDDL